MRDTTLCLTSFVFGDKYQDYIPLFIFSVKKAYPEYHIIIFLNGELKKHIQIQLEFLSEIGSFEIIENYYAEIDFSSSIPHGAAVRWILFDESFLDFDAIYIADIDIFYCKEEISLLEQHLTHCKTIQKPFSNIQRKPLDIKTFNSKTIVRNLKNTSMKYTLNKILFGRHIENKLTGLHFYLTKEYLKKVRPFYEKYAKIISNFKYILHHSNGFNDESCLYDIIHDAGLSDNLPLMTTNKEMLCNSPEYPVFRPHHGLHLGIFRNYQYIKLQTEILDTNVYKMYYHQFCQFEKDIIFKEISNFFSKEMKNEISNMHEFYKNNISKNI